MLLPKLKVLFLCTGNSCRSQMAEAWSRALHGDRIDPYSAGTIPKPIDPRAIEVMREVGIDIQSQRSKHVDEVGTNQFDGVVTVCDSAREACPAFLGSIPTLHVSFDDPPRLAAGLPAGESLAHYRRVRDEIRAFVENLPATLFVAPEPAESRDLKQVLELLQSTGLPTAGVADSFPAAYSVVRAGRELTAVAGLETHGSAGLLRSVAVAGSYRGLGLGRRCVEDRLAFARSRNLGAVYLLTTTAASYFRTLGFEEVPRSEIPDAIQESSEFSAVCPTSAPCFVKRLA